MMKFLKRIGTLWRICLALGWRQVLLFAWYQGTKKVGWLKRQMPVGKPMERVPYPGRAIYQFPTREDLIESLGKDGMAGLIEEAEEILAGKARLFGGMAAPLVFQHSSPLKHALDYGDQVDGRDIKFVWEPARFGWALVLARAYRVSGDHRYMERFWELFREFIRVNPYPMGPNWSSGQEVAIRMLALSFVGQSLAENAKAEDLDLLAGFVKQSANRIELTILYARSQNNNHLLTEASALLAAGLWFDVQCWQTKGLKWLRWCIENQIDEKGEYVQHSTNYHRLMLQTVLWVDWLLRSNGLGLTAKENGKLELATNWLLQLVDGKSGQALNLGHNDGALILPLACGGAEDYRPVVQTAGRAFARRDAFADGAWNEMCCWLGHQAHDVKMSDTGAGNRINGANSWVYLRATQLKNRPAHADQLHLDLWWRGNNLAMDAGTYLYNGDAPWQNGLDAACVHNSVMILDREPMEKVSRFLWLNWDQGRLILADERKIQAKRNGYERFGIEHARRVEMAGADAWLVTDEFRAVKDSGTQTLAIQWLVPDWEWILDGERLTLRRGSMRADIQIDCQGGDVQSVDLVRAGHVVARNGADCNIASDVLRGWVSTVYGVKQPALSVRVVIQTKFPCRIATLWKLNIEDAGR